MKALVVHQPWAWAIVAGHKIIENRTWGTDYRGPLAIVAGKSKASLRKGRAFLEDIEYEDGGPLVIPPAFDFGAIIGTVELIESAEVDEDELEALGDPFATGPYCWVFDRAVMLPEPIPVQGKLGLYPLDAGLSQRVHAACGIRS